MEVSPQFCVVQQEPEESIFAQEKPELPSILQTLVAGVFAQVAELLRQSSPGARPVLEQRRSPVASSGQAPGGR